MPLKNILLLFAFFGTLAAHADTLDVYKVSFRGQPLATFNEKQVINIVMKLDSIYSNDTLQVAVFRDTPCAACKDYSLIIFGVQGPMMIDSSQHTPSFYIPLKPLVEYRRQNGTQQFHGYYTEYHTSGRSRVVAFRIKLE
jgi:hypothetical protein